ncbi:MAG TPA: alcohol dehydrogenase catalytic domain-containing protein, partial [Fimbriimonadaceae bacterium]|nr:alcohol dehydrogenase catalytic domain-containing protein [Fimbriimonadaceae bacterium]
MIALAPLPETMPAAVLEGPGRLAVREIPIWPVERYGDPDLVLLEVEACGVCGSDYRYFAGENPWAQHTLGRFVPNPPNIVLGHEYAGRVVAVASQANRHWLGKRVAAICSKVCGACVDCSAGREHLCAHTVHLGHGQGWGERDFYSGAYARYTLAWGSGSYELPEDVPYEEAAMLDILAVAVHIARVGNVGHGSRVLCIGAGPAGNAVAQAARAMGAHEVWLTDPSEDALAIAQTQGFAS